MVWLQGTLIGLRGISSQVSDILMSVKRKPIGRRAKSEFSFGFSKFSSAVLFLLNTFRSTRYLALSMKLRYLLSRSCRTRASTSNSSPGLLRIAQVKGFEEWVCPLSSATLNNFLLFHYLLHHNRIHWFEGISVQIMDWMLC